MTSIYEDKRLLFLDLCFISEGEIFDGVSAILGKENP